mgnify:CR=1 FL=1
MPIQISFFFRIQILFCTILQYRLHLLIANWRAVEVGSCSCGSNKIYCHLAFGIYLAQPGGLKRMLWRQRRRCFAILQRLYVFALYHEAYTWNKLSWLTTWRTLLGSQCILNLCSVRPTTTRLGHSYSIAVQSNIARSAPICVVHLRRPFLLYSIICNRVCFFLRRSVPLVCLRSRILICIARSYGAFI